MVVMMMEKKKNKSGKAKSDKDQAEKCTNLGGSWRSRATLALFPSSTQICLSFVAVASGDDIKSNIYLQIEFDI